MKKILVVLFVLIVLLPAGVLLFLGNEGGAPSVAVDLPSVYVKKNCLVHLAAEDEKTGLRSIYVSIMQKANEKVLLEKQYHPSIFSCVLPESWGVVKEEFSIPVEIGKYGMVDGPATIRVRVSDASWRHWGKGNVTYLEKEIILDSTAPKLKILTTKHNLCKGGSGLVVYRVFEPDIETGLMVGDRLFPGYSGLFEDPQIHACFFALDHTQGPGTRLSVFAKDKAGNISRRGFRHYIRDRKFRRDTITLSDRFLDGTIAPFDLSSSKTEFAAPLDKFLFINDRVRAENSHKVLQAEAAQTRAEMMWKGRFLRLPGAATRSTYGDHRSYTYKGKKVSKAVHLGMDLASTAHAVVGAANAGRVVLAEDAGIFGNTVIIDHGFGVASLYAHLDTISVEKGQEVKKSEKIGTTGTTGLAGGDHLHFSMIVHNVFVNPLEWWDASWVKHNITSKIQRVRESR